MKLYYAPLACSLADHIALIEAGATFERERVDLKTKLTESGRPIAEISGKAYVPVLVLDDGEVVTENVAVLDWIAGAYPMLGAKGPLGRTRMLEALTFISTELHRAFKPFWHLSSDAEKARAAQLIDGHLRYVARHLHTDYLFGARPSVADFYLFVMLLWAKRFDIDSPPGLDALHDRVAARPAAQMAMRYEGIA